MKRRFLIIPFLFTLASLLQLNYIASIVVSPDQVFRPLLVLWLVVALLLWPAFWLTRDWNWAALLLTVFVLGIYSSSAFFSIVLLVLGIAVICWLAFVRLKCLNVQLSHFMYILGGVSIVLTAYAIILQINLLRRIPWTEYRQSVSSARNYSLPSLFSPQAKPDIYYIVLDGYARADILKELFQYDNSSFITYLQGRGFIVPSSNHSNYPATPLSIASTLNMDYIQDLTPALGEQSHRWLMTPFIDHSRTRALLESFGYKTVSISTNWTITDNTQTDLYFHSYPVMLTDFEGFMLDLTPLQGLEPLLGSFASLPNAESHRRVIQFNLETLADLPEASGPKFVFAHIISPHPPFVFDQQGQPLSSTGSFTFQDANEFPGSSEEYRKNYIGQVQFVNDQLRNVIDTILEQSDTPPIIILQSDHGSGLFTDLTSLQKTCLRERFSPFAAYYFPNLDESKIPEDMSNVNLFRLVFNEYFGADLSLLESKQYFYKDMQTYYEFEDVTAEVNKGCALPKE